MKPRHIELTIRDGRQAVVYATDCGGNTPVHGAILTEGIVPKWIPLTWTSSGRFAHDADHHLDLIGLENHP